MELLILTVLTIQKAFPPFRVGARNAFLPNPNSHITNSQINQFTNSPIHELTNPQSTNPKSQINESQINQLTNSPIHQSTILPIYPRPTLIVKHNYHYFVPRCFSLGGHHQPPTDNRQQKTATRLSPRKIRYHRQRNRFMRFPMPFNPH